MARTPTRTSSIERVARALSPAAWGLAACALSFAAAPAAGQPAAGPRASATPGARLTFPDPGFDDAGTTSWFDRWEHLSHKDDAVPWFLDLLHLDAGWWRADGTPQLRLERWSPASQQEQTRLDAVWRGLDLEAEFRRWRTDALRLTPRGTGQTGEAVVPRLGSFYVDDTDPDDRFFVRRTGGGGALRVRPEDFGRPPGLLRQLSVAGRHELRAGDRQERFLLDDDEAGSGAATRRFRGQTRAIDRDLTTLGGGLVLAPLGLATAALDLGYERFRDGEPVLTVGDLAGRDPALQPAPGAATRAIGFVPDSDRWTGSLRVARSFGAATLHGGAWASRLAQAGTRTPAQRAAGHDDLRVDTWAAHLAGDLPLGERVSFGGFGRFVQRDHEGERDTALFAPDNRSQVDPFLQGLRTWEGGAELTAALAPGARAAAGWRVRAVERDLAYADAVDAAGLPQRAIRPGFALVDDESRTHTVYVRSHARLLRRLRVAGEVGFEWAPEIGSPIDLERAHYGRLRASHGWRRPLPITATLFGGWLDGEGDGLLLESAEPGRSRRKDLERTRWDWGASLSAAPGADTVLTATLVHQRDERRYPHLRSNVPRYSGPPFLRFYVDSEQGWRSDARVAALGATRAFGPRVEASLTGSLTWLDAEVPGGGATGRVLESVNAIDLTIAAVDLGLAFEARRGLRLGLGWRSESYRDRSRVDEPDLDGWQHALTLSATFDLSLVER
jgi:hypothetical protein